MHPSYINSNGNTSFSTINQQRMASLSYYNNETLINLEIATNMQPTMENISTYNNGKFLESDSGINRFNSHLILENKRLTGNRSSKKDRHSKIDTARGPRDRRMRLSLDVAKRFFKLQDMLGFDKASNTVQWLLMKSKAAIQDLSPQQINIKKSCSQLMGVSSKSPSSASECEVLSVLIDDQSIYQNSGKDQVITTTNKGKISSCSSNKKKSTILAKEIREKARARARKRTTEKRNSKLGNDGGEGGDQYSKPRPSVDQDDQNTNRLGFWIPFAEDQVDLTDQAHEYPSSHFGDNTSMMSSDWSPSFLFNNQQNLEPCHEHQLISDFQILDKPWEGNIKN